MSRWLTPSEIVRVPAFKRLSEPTAAELATAGRVYTMHAGESLSKGPGPGNNVVIVVAGTVRVCLFSGRGLTLTFLPMWHPIDMALLPISSAWSAGARAEAVEDATTVYTMPKQELERVACACPELVVALTESSSLAFGAVIEEAFRWTWELTNLDVADRLASLLIRLAHGSGFSVISINRRYVAEVLGCSPEEVSRSLQRLRAAGLVVYRDGYHEVTIPNHDALERSFRN